MKRLGDAEQQTRDALRARGGRWAPGDPPLWENGYWTEQLLRSLVKKEHAIVKADRSFELI